MILNYHPDRNKSPDANHVFGKIHEAYEKIKGVDDSLRNNLVE